MSKKKDQSLAASVPPASESAVRGEDRAQRWRVEGEFDADVSIEIRAEDDSLICEIYPFLEDWTKAEIERAHLIAAAPELLDACQAVKAYLGKLESGDPDDPINALRRTFHGPLLAKLDPAIAKATTSTRTSHQNPAADANSNTNRALKDPLANKGIAKSWPSSK